MLMHDAASRVCPPACTAAHCHCHCYCPPATRPRPKLHSAQSAQRTGAAHHGVGNARRGYSFLNPPATTIPSPSAVRRRPSSVSVFAFSCPQSQSTQEPQVVGSRLSQMFDAVLLVLVLITPPALSPPTNGVYVATHVRCQLSLRLRRRSSLIALALQALSPSACFQVVKLLHCFVVRAKSQI